MMNAPPASPPHGGCCPFCGMATSVPHETQQGCIEALHAEITRIRGLLGHLRSLSDLSSTHDGSGA